MRPDQRQQQPRVAVRTAASPVNPFSVSLAAGCAALAAAGAVPRKDVAFSVAWPLYVFAINTWRFSQNASHRGRPSPRLVSDGWVPKYAALAGLLAILIPGAVCIYAAATGAVGGGGAPAAAVLQALGPHLFLTAAQVVCESLTSGPSTAMLPRMLVPIGFNTYRLWALWDWCRAAAGPPRLGPWHLALAAANLALWSFNLFGFLLLRMVPLYLDPQKCQV